jgi:hypothetical protein
LIQAPTINYSYCTVDYTATLDASTPDDIGVFFTDDDLNSIIPALYIESSTMLTDWNNSDRTLTITGTPQSRHTASTNAPITYNLVITFVTPCTDPDFV